MAWWIVLCSAASVAGLLVLAPVLWGQWMITGLDGESPAHT